MEWPYNSQMFYKKRLEKYLELNSVKRAFQNVTQQGNARDKHVAYLCKYRQIQKVTVGLP
jgi:hypothetical protein